MSEQDMSEQETSMADRFEIPSEIRALAEKSVEQARQAFDGFITAAQNAVSALDDQAATARKGAKDVTEKAMSFAQQNIASSFELARQLVGAKDAQDVMKLQGDYIARQMQVLAEQAKELGRAPAKPPATPRPGRAEVPRWPPRGAPKRAADVMVQCNISIALHQMICYGFFRRRRLSVRRGRPPVFVEAWIGSGRPFRMPENHARRTSPMTETYEAAKSKSKSEFKSKAEPAAFEMPKFELPSFEMPQMEIPAAFREFAEKSVSQAKETYEKMRSAADEATDMLEGTYATATKGASEYGLKVIEATRENTNAAFDFASRLMTVKSFPRSWSFPPPIRASSSRR